MGNNVFYSYIRLKNAVQTELPSVVRQAVFANYGEKINLFLSVCKEDELEACLAEKVLLWNESMAKSKMSFDDAELVIHQIQISNGGLELSHEIMKSIAEANLTLCVTYSVCNLI